MRMSSSSTVTHKLRATSQGLLSLVSLCECFAHRNSVMRMPMHGLSGSSPMTPSFGTELLLTV